MKEKFNVLPKNNEKKKKKKEKKEEERSPKKQAFRWQQNPNCYIHNWREKLKWFFWKRKEGQAYLSQLWQWRRWQRSWIRKIVCEVWLKAVSSCGKGGTFRTWEDELDSLNFLSLCLCLNLGLCSSCSCYCSR